LEPFYANSGSETSKSVTFSLMFAVILCWSIFHILLYVFKFGISMFSDSLSFLGSAKLASHWCVQENL
jgi:hypothetical protein